LTNYLTTESIRVARAVPAIKSLAASLQASGLHRQLPNPLTSV
jgi:hypothetical protein